MAACETVGSRRSPSTDEEPVHEYWSRQAAWSFNMMLVRGGGQGRVGFGTASRAGRIGMKVWVTYGLSMFVYIMITFFTKRLLSWNLALLYFVVTLEVLPRTYR